MKRTPQTEDKYVLRLPDGMRDRIKAAAEKNNRSMNAEILHRLELTFDNEGLFINGAEISAIREAAKKSNRSFIEEFRARISDSFIPTTKADKSLRDETNDLYTEVWELRKMVKELNKTLLNSVHYINKRIKNTEGISINMLTQLDDNETNIDPSFEEK